MRTFTADDRRREGELEAKANRARLDAGRAVRAIDELFGPAVAEAIRSKIEALDEAQEARVQFLAEITAQEPF